MKTAISFAAWNILADQVRVLRPPTRLMDAHNQLLITATHFEKAGELLANGLDEMDGDLLEQGSAEMQLGVTAIELANDKMDSLSTPTATALPTKPVATATTQRPR